MEGGEVDLQGLLEIVPNNEVADSIINKLTGDFKLSIDEVKDLARVYSMSDVPNPTNHGELMTGFFLMIKLWVHWEVYQVMASRHGLYANIH